MRHNRSYGSFSPKRVRVRNSSSFIKELSKIESGVIIEKPFKLINQIKERSQKKNPYVDPALASIVVKSYILPLFAMETQHQQSKSRISIFNNRSPANIISPPAKLSQQIQDIYETTQNYLQLLKEKLKKTEDLTEDARLELDCMKSNLKDSESLLSTMTQSLDNYKSEIKKEKLMGTYRHKEKLDLQKRHKEEIVKREKIVSQLEDRKKQNLVLSEGTQEYIHLQFLLSMDSAIVGERLKGLYDACLCLAYPEGSESEIKNLFVLTFKNAEKTILKEDMRLKYAEIELPNIVNLMVGSSDAFNRRKELITELKKTRMVVINKIQTLDQGIENNYKDKELFQKTFSFTETRLTSLNEDLGRTKVKINEILGVGKRGDLNTEKLCQFCGKMYTDKENFNWSCHTHTSAWSGSMYWCCGKTTKESVGCKLQKHNMKDESEEIQNDKPEKRKFCSSCKKTGHSLKDCTNDPNIKQGLQNRTLTPGRISYDKIGELFRKKKIKFKRMKNESIEELKESLSKSNLRVSKSKKNNWRSTISPAPSTPSVNSPLFEHFPLISRRKVSLTKKALE